MRAVSKTRSVQMRPGCARVALCLTLMGAGIAAAGPAVPGSALDQLQAAQAAARQMQQNPPSVPADWRHAKDINEASRRFADWQAEMFRQREEIARKQAKLLHDRMKVPPPLPPSEPDTGPAMTRLDLPLPFWPGIDFSMSVGEPTVSVGVGAKGEALSCVGASYKVQAAYTAKDNRLVVADPLEISASFGSEKVKAAGSYQLLGAIWTGADQEGPNEGGKKPVGGEISVDFLQVNAAVGYSTDRTLSLGAGYDFLKTPKGFSKIVDVSVGVEGRVEAPVVVHGLTKGGKYGLPTMLADYSAKVAKLLTESQPCPYCLAQGDLKCPTCENARTVTCRKCSGKGRHACNRCTRGTVSCSTCKGSGKEVCGSCKGKGRVACRTCGGRGTMRYWRSETRTRQRTVVDRIGFDSAGQPVYESHTQPEDYTESVTYWDDCGTCGGSGDGGDCGRCNRTGRVTCHKCRGSGKAECRTCDGAGQVDCRSCRHTGKIPCPTCRGKTLKCPLCKGKKTVG